ncbi:hypothetical protein DAY19_10235 [Halobacteriovorax vibrionivorans]|uniref:Uncharacterized protein n=1 Tax=Halobacteriovorax vibrionivorans TaxID=2152716 RepID=A0ABY0IHJ2_9BACT|nr:MULTISPECIES: hypothetical protein [Halobacteriovorax]RZF22050.1 hypothetical protein DAY19_10235 [Halobacteriovorax vibrionivorans]TGD47086.1 hypothetical protein EP118_09300 [Halobacteriovorax sp. Y22]
MKRVMSGVLSVLILSTSVSAHASDFESYVRTIKNAKLDSQLEAEIKDVVSRNKLPLTRPEFCPLNNTRSYEQALTSLKNIVTVFKDDCFDGNESLIGNLIDSSNELETELNKLKEEQGKETTDVIPSSEEVTVDGIPVAQVINGVNTLFSNNSCSSLERTPFLERSADIIQTFSQFGLYSPSGITVAYGGLAVASILRFVSNIFNDRFEFENEEDINTFVKLNCAYYDVRNQVKALEIFDIDTQRHYTDRELSKALVAQIKKDYEALVKAKENVEAEFEKIKSAEVNKIDAEVEKLISGLYEKMKTPLTDLPGKSARYQQAEVLGELAFSKDLLEEYLDSYISESKGADRFLNILFKQKLSLLDNPMALMEMSVKDFNKEFLADMASSFNRVLKNISAKREKARSIFDDTYIISLGDENITVKEYKELLKSEDLKKREKRITDALAAISDVDNRLAAIIAKKEYSSEDSKDGDLREIIKSLDIIRNHVYGKYGREFVDKMRSMAEDQNKNFNDKYKDLEKHYNISKSGESDDLGEDRKLNACVDVQTTREVWVYAQKLSELGYDFLATNNDIFGDADNKDRRKIKSHNDSAILARRIITARNYLKKISMQRELGRSEVEIEGETYSLEVADNVARTINFYGKELTLEEAQEYLDDKFGHKGLRADRLGQIMMEIVNNRDRTVGLQKFYKKNKCSNLTTITR